MFYEPLNTIEPYTAVFLKVSSILASVPLDALFCIQLFDFYNTKIQALKRKQQGGSQLLQLVLCRCR